mmetsp:Transcript_48036/g.154984  ORF Transcript_48036/g.154984 Transcript_48036/m.154984 type:complete len:317 (+) Transcript_48036:387-1337(+)
MKQPLVALPRWRDLSAKNASVHRLCCRTVDLARHLKSMSSSLVSLAKGSSPSVTSRRHPARFFMLRPSLADPRLRPRRPSRRGQSPPGLHRAASPSGFFPSCSWRRSSLNFTSLAALASPTTFIKGRLPVLPALGRGHSTVLSCCVGCRLSSVMRLVPGAALVLICVHRRTRAPERDCACASAPSRRSHRSAGASEPSCSVLLRRGHRIASASELNCFALLRRRRSAPDRLTHDVGIIAIVALLIAQLGATLTRGREMANCHPPACAIGSFLHVHPARPPGPTHRPSSRCRRPSWSRGSPSYTRSRTSSPSWDLLP